MPVAQAIAGCPLSCVVVNVNGMRNKTKRRTLFQRLRTLRCCIIILCETHSRDDAETTAWTQEGAGPGLPWEGHAFWHHGTYQSIFFLACYMGPVNWQPQVKGYTGTTGFTAGNPQEPSC